MHFWKFWNGSSKNRAVSKFSKITRVIYPKSQPNQICSCWLITPKNTLHWNKYLLIAENYKITALTLSVLGWVVPLFMLREGGRAKMPYPSNFCFKHPVKLKLGMNDDLLLHFLQTPAKFFTLGANCHMSKTLFLIVQSP